MIDKIRFYQASSSEMFGSSYDEDIKKDIYDCMQYFTTGNKNVNPELVKYLFIGWYIHSLIEKEPKNC
mgnify:CR=1 FL=1